MKIDMNTNKTSRKNGFVSQLLGGILNDFGKRKGKNGCDKRYTVNKCLSVSTSYLKKCGLFNGLPYQRETISWENIGGEEKASIEIAVLTFSDTEKYAKFLYSSIDPHTGKKTEYNYDVKLAITPCNYGGKRHWFICPHTVDGVGCERRVAKLYLPPNATYFGCRHCYKLFYDSRNESRSLRPGGELYHAKLYAKMTKLASKVRRWKYRGKPTKKAEKVAVIAEAYERAKAAIVRA
ncbi:MAG: hypothetical protein ABR913_07850 [Sedimentisphaerales bacterium]|jgi:hypothetical protein